MGSQASAARSHRSSEAKRERNKPIQTSVRTHLNRFNRLLSTGKVDEAKVYLPKVINLLDTAAQKGIIHMNNAARRKSRITRRLNEAVKTNQTSPAAKPSARKAAAK